jgi:bifunctional non-homologous end joining protein LigD
MAAKSRLVSFIEPMALQLVNQLPEGAGWLYEVKFDGYRALILKDGDHVEIRSRNDRDLTRTYSAIAAAGRRLRAKRTIVDGEIVALDTHGRPSFQALQHRGVDSGHHVIFYAFDLLHENGKDLTAEPLTSRRARLLEVVDESGLLLSRELPGGLPEIIEAVRAFGLEGVVAKRRNSIYEPGERSGAWQKLKFELQQEFVVGGYRPGGKAIDALLVGFHQDGKLCFAGKVRAGFVPHVRKELFKQLEPLRIDRCPFTNLPDTKRSRWGGGVTAEDMREFQWVTPTVVVQIRFIEWTADGRLRHAVFVGLRPDKHGSEVRREVPLREGG